jgi:hypothetical protein
MQHNKVQELLSVVADSGLKSCGFSKVENHLLQLTNL